MKVEFIPVVVAYLLFCGVLRLSIQNVGSVEQRAWAEFSKCFGVSPEYQGDVCRFPVPPLGR